MAPADGTLANLFKLSVRFVPTLESVTGMPSYVYISYHIIILVVGV